MTAVTLTADGTTSVGGKAKAMVRDSVKTVIAASMVGTAIEFYDFYAYGTAAANYFPHIFFSAKDNPTVALLMSLLTFAVAFIARPLGSLLFGHFGPFGWPGHPHMSRREHRHLHEAMRGMSHSEKREFIRRRMRNLCEREAAADETGKE